MLLAGHGYSNTEIAGQAGVSRPAVIMWRARYEQGGIGALEDKARSGRPAEIDPLAIVIATLGAPPQKLG